MILVDTSIWIDHLRKSSKVLIELLEDDRVLTHSFVIGELALSGLVNRDELVELLEALPRAKEATHEEALEAVRQRKLHGRGIGWVDTHLLAAALLSDAHVWTADKRLRAVSAEAGVAYRAGGP